MHMADALLAPAVAATMYAATAVTVGASVKTLKKDETTAKLPTMAVTSALVFAGQMINYTIPGTGSSGHLCGGMMLTALLGPQAGFLSMVVILAIQALFFADGGLLALGANCWNMAFYGCFVGALIWRAFMRKGITRKKIIAASLLGCVLTLQLGAFSVTLETLASGITELPFTAFLAVMQPIHLAIGLVEGAVTAAVLVFLQEARPSLLWQAESADSQKQPMTLRGVLGVMENIGSGLVDGHRTGIGDGIGLLLADVQLKGLKMQFTLAHDKVLISVFILFDF